MYTCMYILINYIYLVIKLPTSGELLQLRQVRGSKVSLVTLYLL